MSKAKITAARIMRTPLAKAAIDRMGKGKCIMQKLIYRARYWFRTVCRFLGLCEKCGSVLNFTRRKRAICPKCGR